MLPIRGLVDAFGRGVVANLQDFKNDESRRRLFAAQLDKVAHELPFNGAKSTTQLTPMTNLASVLRSEVTRLARKELRAETESMKKAVTVQRSEIAALKRRTLGLEKALKKLVHSTVRAVAQAERSSVSEQGDAEMGQFRFRAQGMASNRRRLGLSAEDFGLLVGTTGQSVY